MGSKLVTNKIFVAITAIFCCALWGTSTPIVKMGYAYVNSTHTPSLLFWVGIQFVIAGIFIILTQSITCKKFALPKKKSIVGTILVALFQTVLQYSLLYIGLAHTSSVKGAVLKSTDVFFIAILSSVVFKMEKLTLKNFVACFIGFSGIIVMNLNGLSFNISPLGDGLVVLAILFYSLGVIITKLTAKEEEPLVLCGYQMLIGGAVMFAIGALTGGKINFVKMLPIILVLSLIYAVAYSLWTFLLKYNSASGVSIFSFATPIFGVLFSAILLSENSGVAPISLALALFLVCFGIILWGYEKKKG